MYSPYIIYPISLNRGVGFFLYRKYTEKTMVNNNKTPIINVHKQSVNTDNMGSNVRLCA